MHMMSSKAVTSGVYAGEYETTWQGDDMSADVIAAAGAQLSVGNDNGVLELTVVPPEDVPVSSRNPLCMNCYTPWVVPPDHQYFNPQDIVNWCHDGACVNVSSIEYSIQETPGDVIMAQKATGQMWGGHSSGPSDSGNVTKAGVFTTWPNSTGDKPEQEWPDATTHVDNGRDQTYTVGVTNGGFSFSYTVNVPSQSSYGPYWPSGRQNPGFGGQYLGCWEGGQGYFPLGEASYVVIGAGQSDWDQLHAEANGGCSGAIDL